MVEEYLNPKIMTFIQMMMLGFSILELIVSVLL